MPVPMIWSQLRAVEDALAGRPFDPAALAAAKVTLEGVERLHPHQSESAVSGLVRAATGLPPTAPGGAMDRPWLVYDLGFDPDDERGSELPDDEDD